MKIERQKLHRIWYTFSSCSNESPHFLPQVIAVGAPFWAAGWRRDRMSWHEGVWMTCQRTDLDNKWICGAYDYTNNRPGVPSKFGCFNSLDCDCCVLSVAVTLLMQLLFLFFKVISYISLFMWVQVIICLLLSLIISPVSLLVSSILKCCWSHIFLLTPETKEVTNWSALSHFTSELPRCVLVKSLKTSASFFVFSVKISCGYNCEFILSMTISHTENHYFNVHFICFVFFFITLLNISS